MPKRKKKSVSAPKGKTLTPADTEDKQPSSPTPIKNEEAPEHFTISDSSGSDDDDDGDGSIDAKRIRKEDQQHNRPGGSLDDIPEDVLAVLRDMGSEWQPKELRRAGRQGGAATTLNGGGGGGGVPANYYYYDVELDDPDLMIMEGGGESNKNNGNNQNGLPSSSLRAPPRLAPDPKDDLVAATQIAEATEALATQQDDNSSLRAHLEQLVSNNTQLVGANAKLRGQCADSDAFAAEMSVTNQQLQDDHNELLSAHVVRDMQLEAAQEELAEMRNKIEEMQKKVEEAGCQVVEATRSADTHRLKSCVLDHLLGKGSVKGNISLPKDCHIIGMNPCLTTGWVYKAFKAGCEKLGHESIVAAVESGGVSVGFHGTPQITNVPPIFCGGFDPARRHGQAHGVGEYFDQDMSQCWGFAKGCAVIVSLVLRNAPKPPQATPENWIVVTNPPREEGITYCYPVMALRTGNSGQLIPPCATCAAK